MSKKLKRKMARTLYALPPQDNDEYYIADESLDNFEDGDVLGIYELKEVVEIQRTTTTKTVKR